MAKHGADVTGVISGYDRLRLRGSLRHLYQPTFMFRYLCSAGVRLKDFAGFVSGLTNRVCAASAAFAAACGRPLRYLESCLERKEDPARRLAERDRMQEGLSGQETGGQETGARSFSLLVLGGSGFRMFRRRENDNDYEERERGIRAENAERLTLNTEC